MRRKTWKNPRSCWSQAQGTSHALIVLKLSQQLLLLSNLQTHAAEVRSNHKLLAIAINEPGGDDLLWQWQTNSSGGNLYQSISMEIVRNRPPVRKHGKSRGSISNCPEISLKIFACDAIMYFFWTVRNRPLVGKHGKSRGVYFLGGLFLTISNQGGSWSFYTQKGVT